MGLFFEKSSSQSKTQKKLINAFIILIVLDLINNFLLNLSWLSTITTCSYIVFLILFIREIMRGKNNKAND
ncbi:hypothetical protein J2S21_003285 [Peribacillus cavernae]|nr:hypothetical protein [Peribacillus cavernae]